jgi:hypothetical protein
LTDRQTWALRSQKVFTVVQSALLLQPHAPLTQAVPSELVEQSGHTAHVPRLQTWPGGHTFPQVPQLVESVAGSVHPLQSICPDGQTQPPLLQIFPPLQLFPQAPQLVESVSVFVHPLQSVSPARQAHVPALQIMPPVQLLPQVPQLLASLETSAHAPLQFVWPLGHSVLHAPAAQT